MKRKMKLSNCKQFQTSEWVRRITKLRARTHAWTHTLAKSYKPNSTAPPHVRTPTLCDSKLSVSYELSTNWPNCQRSSGNTHSQLQVIAVIHSYTHTSAVTKRHTQIAQFKLRFYFFALRCWWMHNGSDFCNFAAAFANISVPSVCTITTTTSLAVGVCVCGWGVYCAMALHLNLMYCQVQWQCWRHSIFICYNWNSVAT